MNILSTNGLVGRYVTDWSGPGRGPHRRQHPARGAQLSRRHHDPDRRGHRQGRRRRRRRDGGRVEVTLRGANSLGDHVTGTVRLPSLPRRGVPDERPDQPRLRRQHRHRRHRRHRVLQGVGPQRAAPGRRGGRPRPARRRHRAVRGGRAGHLQLRHQPRDRHRPQPGHGGAVLLQPHPLRRRRRVRHHPAGGAGRRGRGGRRGRLLPGVQRALGQPVRRRRPGPPAGRQRRDGPLRLVRAPGPAHPGPVGGHGRPAVPARDRGHLRGPGTGGGGRPQARRHQPEGLVLREADHPRGPPELPVDRRAPPPPRLLPGDRRRPGAGGHLAGAGPRPSEHPGRHPGRRPGGRGPARR